MEHSKKILILSYYWPPAGGSGVQRWMYFAKYLKQFGWEPIVLTVDEKQASYAILDPSLLAEVKDVRVIKTSTREPLKWYSRLTSGSSKAGIPQGEVNTTSFFGKCAAYIRGNFFIPDARKGWVPFAVEAAEKLLQEETIQHLITTGPPHSTHLAGLQLSNTYQLNWWVDFRDPWTSVFYNNQMFRTKRSKAKDEALERQVLNAASGVITTVGRTLVEKLKAIAPKQRFIVLPNGYDSALVDAIQGDNDKNYFHIVYTGLLTKNQAYAQFIQVLKQLKGERPIRFSLAGNIASSIINEIKQTLPEVEVVDKGYLAHHEAICLMKSGDLLLNFIFDGAQTEMISGKLLEYFATEVPVLSIGDPSSAAGEFIAQGNCARMFKPSQEKEIFDFINELYAAKHSPRNAFPQLQNWTREAICKQLIDDVLS